MPDDREREVHTLLHVGDAENVGNVAAQVYLDLIHRPRLKRAVEAVGRSLRIAWPMLRPHVTSEYDLINILEAFRWADFGLTAEVLKTMPSETDGHRRITLAIHVTE